MSGFDLYGFTSESFAPREQDVDVPELAPFFPAGDPPVFRVRGLTGEEEFRVAAERRTGELQAAVAEALAGGQRAEIADTLKELLGVGDSVPDAMARSISKVAYGLLAPKMARDQVVKLFHELPVVGARLLQAIDALTGQGPDLGKPGPSTPSPES